MVGLSVMRDEEVAWESAAPMENGVFLTCVQPASKLCKNHVLNLEFAAVELDVEAFLILFVFFVTLLLSFFPPP